MPYVAFSSRHLLTSTCLVAIATSAGLFTTEVRSQSFAIPTGTTISTQRTLTGTDTGQIAPGGALRVGGGTASLLIGTATGVAITNNGTLEQTGTGRAIDVTGGTTTRSFLISNSASGIIRTAQNDVIRVNVAVTGTTITIDNSGLIQAGGTGFAGLGQALDFRSITATSGNSIAIINRAGGIIESLTDDAVRPGQGTTIQNSGTIRSFGANTSGGANGTSDAIDAGARTGITVTNNSGGLISGARHGITADNDITVTNNAGATIIGRNGSGVGSDGNGTVTNYGTITGAYAGAGNIFNSDGTASLNGDGDGVDIDLIGTVRNFGIIQGLGAGGVDSGGRPNGSDGIAMGGGTIQNYAGALISGANRGILIDDGAFGSAVAAVSITNAGTIQGLAGTGIGIVGNFANTIVNSGTITGTGSEAALFINGNGNNTLTNAGTIATSGSAQAVFLNGSGTNAVVNTGTIATSGAGVALQFGNGNNILTTSGTIRAASASGTAVVFGNGNNTMTVQGGEIVGNVTAGTGSNSLTFALGTGSFAINSAFSGFSTATVESGKLVVNGSLSSSGGLMIASGASLGGSGVLPALTVNGTLSPGNSIGVISINGDLTLGASSTTVIEIQGSTADRISVAGSARLNGTLQFVAAGGPYLFGTPYTFVTATGGVTGTYSAVTPGSFGVAIAQTVGYGSNAVNLTLAPAPLVVALAGTTSGLTPVLGLSQSVNVSQVGYALDRAAASGADLSLLYPVYSQATKAGLAGALNTLSGEIHTATPAIGYRMSDQFLRTMLDPFASGRDGRVLGGGASDFTADMPGRKGREPSTAPALRIEPSYNLWAALSGQTGRTDGDARNSGSAKREINDGNLTAGADLRVMPGAIAGFALSAGRADARLGNGMGSSEADVLQVGLYGATRTGALRLGVSASYGSMQIETRRSVPVLGQSPVADYRADVFAGRLQASYDVTIGNGFTISPFAALQVQSVRTPDFRETGVQPGTGVTGRGNTNTAMRSELGLRASAATSAAGRPMTLFGELGWGHNIMREMAFAGSLAAIPAASFVVTGARTDRHAALFAAGFDYRLSSNIVIGGRIDGSAASNSRTLGGTTSLKVSF